MFWLVLLVLVLLCFIGIIMDKKSGGYNLGWGLLSIVSSLTLFILLVAWPSSYYGDEAKIQEYYATKSTIAEARDYKVDAMERIAIQNEILATNKFIAREQYWNQTWLDPWIPDEIMDLELLK